MDSVRAIADWPVERAAAAVVRADGTVLGTHGPADHEFALASVTKLLTAYATLVAVEEGALECAGTYKYMWISPNLVNDGHGGPLPIPGIDNPAADLKASDDWLKAQLPAILNSTIYKAGGVIFLTWDEAEGRTTGPNAKDQVPMIVLSPKIKSAGMMSGTALSHASYLATVEDAFGLPRLGAAVGAATLMEFIK